MVSGSPDVSNSFVSPYSSSFVSQSGWWCPALRMSPNSFVFPYSNSFLPVWLVVSGSPDVSNSFVSPYINSFVSQSGWWCPALRMSPIHLSPLIAIHLSPSLAGGVRLSGCLQFICLPLWQFICLPVWLVVSGSPDVSNSFVSPYINSFVSQSRVVVSGSPDVSNSFVFPYSNSFVSQSGWWCPALRMSPIHLFPLIAIHLSPQSGWWCPALRCLQFICLPLLQFICLPVWLVVSGSPKVSNSFVSPYSNSFVSQSGWWCPALRMFPIHLSPLIAIHLSPSLAGGVRLSGCLQIHFSSLTAIHFSQSGWWCPALRMSPIHLSPLISIHLSPSLAGGVRLSGCLQFICLPL